MFFPPTSTTRCSRRDVWHELVGSSSKRLSSLGELVGEFVVGAGVVGALEGDLVGEFVVGALVGKVVGALEGGFVGCRVGDFVGGFVGALVGEFVGGFVGALVGEAVGPTQFASSQL